MQVHFCHPAKIGISRWKRVEAEFSRKSKGFGPLTRVGLDISSSEAFERARERQWTRQPQTGTVYTIALFDDLFLHHNFCGIG